MKKENRSFPIEEMRVDTEGDAPKLSGYAAMFGKKSQDLGGFTETIRQGAFKKTIQEADVRALWNHNADMPLARTKNGTLALSEDKRGLAFEMTPIEASYTADLLKAIDSGLVDQMSFGFRTVKDEWTEKGNKHMRELLEVELFDVSPVTYPAYTQTKVKVRSALQDAGIDVDTLSGILIRSSSGVALKANDMDVIHSTIDVLSKLLPEEPDASAHSSLDAYKRRLELAAAS